MSTSSPASSSSSSSSAANPATHSSIPPLPISSLLPLPAMLHTCSFSDSFFVCLPLLLRQSCQSILQAWTSKTMALQATCSNVSESDSDCTDVSVALHLKIAAMVCILFAGACGVALPLFGRRFSAFKTDGPCFMLAKAFAAGVILATGFVHMLPDAAESLTNSCLPEFPWRQFPFSDCIAMLAALVTLMIDVVGTEYYERKHAREKGSKVEASSEEWVEGPADAQTNKDIVTLGNHMHVVGIHAHAASHTHTHPHGHHSCIDGSGSDILEHAQTQGIHEHVSSDAHDHSHGHSSCTDEIRTLQHKPVQISTSEDVSAHIRHVVVSQVLELGIVAHSVIIGITLGVSESPCTIRPLFAALSFHQFFEGFALGGCISEAGFKSFLTMAMAVCFTLTTPLGIAVGTAISSEFNANSPISLIVEGVFDSVSAGILIYMALVDLIAADFLSKRMQCNFRLRILSYGFLILGAASMSAIAIWT